ncbi:sensor histidine kinase [Jannaschia rubra]|uniref:histidine kinase n=1 Tax=Jannaschia rubra TaxID=282197 RepID=A0A0M6XLB4_9RHOB|nr:ATP-binding protein [Jannaschia rubra]CTQ31889.1 Signal transduction histidine-protein kinase BaeS [Jannaschia rubra]SFG78135.1 HAMP domain-containing protein [Jannaschia rubra]
MRIRTKILSSHAILAATVALICVVIIFTLRVADGNRRQLAASYEQLRNIDLIATEANHYVEQIAELIIIGPQGADMEHARAALRSHIATQRVLIAGEIDWLQDPEERDGEIAELALIDRIEALVDDLDEVYARLSSELAAGRRDVADALYRDEVEDRLDDELGALIAEVLAREQDEAEKSLAASARLSRQSIWLASGLVLVVATLGAVNVVMLNRTVLRPVTALAEAADAVGRGDLSHIVEPGSEDELGHLAQRFNRMTRQILDQRDALQSTNETLERQVAERTAELFARSEELETVNARLREIDTSRAQFFADISHELRTPLTILRGQAEIALRRRDATPEQVRETLEAVVRKAGQMGRLVEDMLFLARSEHGAVGVELEPVTLQEIVSETLLDSQTLARRKGIVLSPRQPLDPVIVQGDADRLRQALQITLDNAIKFGPENSTVRIALETSDGRAVIRVQDEGPGFAEAESERVFTRFYRGEANRGKTGRGSGLGLSIAKWIVERHSGAIGVDGSAETGATVTIDLPLAAGAA